MTPMLMDYLCDPISKEPLVLIDAVYDDAGNISKGQLVSANGAAFPILNGIPRFVPNYLAKSVESFGNEWNYFNFTDFKSQWLAHTVTNTFGTTDVFKDKIIVDAGGGSGAQTTWMLQSGARHVILMDLSHSVDDVVQRNLKPSGFTNYDVIQCSIDMPPIKEQSINGIVYCHNVIQHTPSVEKTAEALFAIVAPGGELVFNCYGLNDQGVFRWIRFHIIHKPLRQMLSHMPFWAILGYAKLMGIIRLIPGIGLVAEKAMICSRGDVPSEIGKSVWAKLKRSYKATVLNTFDFFGSHTFQHHLSEQQQRQILQSLQPDAKKILNVDKSFGRPVAIGCAFRVYR